jgi:uncharacterized membrane protein
MKTKLSWLENVLLAAPFLVLAALWTQLPARVPIHWNLQGEINGWASKPAGLLSLPLISLALNVLLRFAPRFDPKLRGTLGKEDRMSNVLQILRLTFAAFSGAVFYVLIMAALARPVATGRITLTSTLLLFAIMGNYLGNLRPNYFAGIRTPWTLESPATWRATHRLGGRLMFFGSLLLLALQFFISESAADVVFIGSVLLLAVWGFWYSWRHFRTHGPRAEPFAGPIDDQSHSHTIRKPRSLQE